MKIEDSMIQTLLLFFYVQVMDYRGHPHPVVAIKRKTKKKSVKIEKKYK